MTTYDDLSRLRRPALVHRQRPLPRLQPPRRNTAPSRTAGGTVRPYAACIEQGHALYTVSGDLQTNCLRCGAGLTVHEIRAAFSFYTPRSSAIAVSL